MEGEGFKEMNTSILDNLTNNLTIDANEIISKSEEKVSTISGWVVNKFSEIGITLTSFAVKILTLIIIAVFIYLVTKISNKVLKVVLIILIIVFIISLFVSFFYWA